MQIEPKQMRLDSIKLPNEWKELLHKELQSDEFERIRAHYYQALRLGATIYPPPNLTFNAFNLTLPKDIKIVILGQDPYHGSVQVRLFSADSHNVCEIPQAMGLSFSVPKPLPPPPSLKNIYKELAQSVGFKIPTHGDLSAWARKGVFLLNSILSVEAHKPTSHKHFGWEKFSDSVISAISLHCDGVVFLLWGNYAKKKATLIDASKHCIITAPHPSPLAQGFVGSGVFVKANQYLSATQGKAFDWSVE